MPVPANPHRDDDSIYARASVRPAAVRRSAPNALAAAAPLFRGEVAIARAALVRAVTRAGGGVPAGREAVPEEASRARALGLPVAWADLEAASWE